MRCLFSLKIEEIFQIHFVRVKEVSLIKPYVNGYAKEDE